MRSWSRRRAKIVVGRGGLRQVDAAVANAAGPVIMREHARKMEKGPMYTIPSSLN